MKYLRLIFANSNNIPRWFIFLFDIGLGVAAFVLAVILRFNFQLNSARIGTIIQVLPVIISVKAIFMMYFRISSGIIRHTGIQDGLRIGYTITLSTLTFLVVDTFYHAFTKVSYLPLSIIILDFFITTFLLAGFRIFIKSLYLRVAKSTARVHIPYAIFGAGEAGVITKKKLDQHNNGESRVVAFFDDNPNMFRKIIDGVQIYNFDLDFDPLIQKYSIENLIISVSNLSKSRKQDIIEKCLANNINVRTVPPIEKWINGELSYNQLKHVKIEDLIERDTIQLDKVAIGSLLNGKTILVTGAAGSIGSEIVRQLLQFRPKKLICVDKSEEGLYKLDSELSQNFNNEYNAFVEIMVGDINNNFRMRSIFSQFRPELVYHAAAYKHVPLMEDNACEALLVNINGTKNIADLAVEFGVAKFVLVSTDKAVNPTNVMGASKRSAEIYVQSLNNHLRETGNARTKFITTRFGNVLGSSGSVIPRFRKQIEEGGPVTVTHPEITRYFMTIPEACQLVLEAGNMGNGGEIYIFDMGKSIKIVDLAKKMIKLSGFTLGKDIQIVFTGLRPGEKIYEELLDDHENTLPTHHPKIMIGKVRAYDFNEVSMKVNNLIDLYSTQDEMKIVARIKELVPEFKSKNSIFESLDNDVVLPDKSDLERMLLR